MTTFLRPSVLSLLLFPLLASAQEPAPKPDGKLVARGPLQAVEPDASDRELRTTPVVGRAGFCQFDEIAASRSEPMKALHHQPGHRILQQQEAKARSSLAVQVVQRGTALADKTLMKGGPIVHPCG